MLSRENIMIIVVQVITDSLHWTLHCVRYCSWMNPRPAWTRWRVGPCGLCWSDSKLSMWLCWRLTTWMRQTYLQVLFSHH